MKKIFITLFVFLLALSLVACGGNADVDNNEEESTYIDETHVHDYTSEIIAEPTCTDEGAMTFTCSCGDTYTETTSPQHKWSEWEVEAIAMIGKNGSESRACTVCSEKEARERTANAISNSFYDVGLVFFGTNDTCKLTGPGLLRYCVTEYPEYRGTPVKTADIFGKIADRFDIPEQLISDSKYWGQLTGLYNDTNDTFVIEHDENTIESANLKLLGYVHNGDKNYTVYYQCNNGVEDRYCQFELEYNRLEGKPNKYLSQGLATALPDNLIKCAEGEQVEYNSAK